MEEAALAALPYFLIALPIMCLLGLGDSGRRSLNQALIMEEADERYRGGPEKPFTREQLHGKFTDCASLVLRPHAIAETIERLESLEQARNIRDVVGVLTAGALEGQPAVFSH